MFKLGFDEIVDVNYIGKAENENIDKYSFDYNKGITGVKVSLRNFHVHLLMIVAHCQRAVVRC